MVIGGSCVAIGCGSGVGSSGGDGSMEGGVSLGRGRFGTSLRGIGLVGVDEVEAGDSVALPCCLNLLCL